MNAIFAIALKDLKLLFRDKTGFFFTFFFPIIIAVFFGSIFSDNSGKPSGLSVLVVDEDNTVGSAAFVAELQASDELNIEITSRDLAVEQVRLGNSVAYLAIKKGFGEAQKNVFWGEPPEIELGIDPARRGTAGMLQGILMKYGVAGMQKRFSDPDIMHGNITDALQSLRTDSAMEPSRKQHLEGFLSQLDLFLTVPTPPPDPSPDQESGFSGFQPLVISAHDIVMEKKGPQSGYAISFPQGIMWGVIGCAASFGISLVIERTRGTMMRLRTAPIHRLQILGGKALACFLRPVRLASVSSGLRSLFSRFARIQCCCLQSRSFR